MRQSFKYHLYPNKAQQQIIENTLEHCRLLYNRLLAERKEAYEKSGKTLSYVAQANSFPARKEAIPALHAVHSQVLQDVAKRVPSSPRTATTMPCFPARWRPSRGHRPRPRWAAISGLSASSSRRMASALTIRSRYGRLSAR